MCVCACVCFSPSPFSVHRLPCDVYRGILCLWWGFDPLSHVDLSGTRKPSRRFTIPFLLLFFLATISLISSYLHRCRLLYIAIASIWMQSKWYVRTTIGVYRQQCGIMLPSGKIANTIKSKCYDGRQSLVTLFRFSYFTLLVSVVGFFFRLHRLDVIQPAHVRYLVIIL